jgi:hypothetical protein
MTAFLNARKQTPQLIAERKSVFTSIAIILVSAVLAYAPIPGAVRTISIVSGTELQEPLEALKSRFEQENPGIQLDLKFQGSQELANRFLDDQNDFKPTVLIPANGEIIQELGDRWRTRNSSEAFYDRPQAIAKTILVGISWSERGKVLFPNGRFDWQQVERAMMAESWGALGGQSNWGSFDFVITDPIRSNSGQLGLSLWAQSKLGSELNSTSLASPTVATLFSLIKRSVYHPPRSSDILLQEFITRGANDADVATVYESVVLHRWQQSATTQGKPYQIYYLNPTIETISTAAIVRRNVDAPTAEAARKFLDFLVQPTQQATFVQFGFRPAIALEIKSVSNSPWSQNIPGAEVSPAVKILPTPNPQVIDEIQRLWERAN